MTSGTLNGAWVPQATHEKPGPAHSRLAGPLAGQATDLRTTRPIHADMLVTVLPRLPEQSEGQQPLRLKCLDAWDLLLSERVGIDILKQIDE